MQADISQWYVRWFQWSCRTLDNFWGLSYRRESRYSSGTNLCHFFRTLLFGGVVTLWSLTVYSAFIFVCAILPFILFPPVSVATLIGTVILAIAAIVVAIAAIVVALVAIFGSCGAVKWTVDKVSDYNARSAIAENPGFFRVMWNYVVAIKQRYCPTIRFGKKESN